MRIAKCPAMSNYRHQMLSLVDSKENQTIVNDLFDLINYVL